MDPNKNVFSRCLDSEGKSEGLNLEEYFLGKALESLLSNNRSPDGSLYDDPDTLAEHAIDYVDSLIVRSLTLEIERGGPEEEEWLK